MKIAIIRSETPLTAEQQENARNNVRKQLPADWAVLVLPRQMTADFLEIVASEDSDAVNVVSSVSYPQHNPQANGYADMFRARFDDIFGTSKPPAPPEPPPTRHIKDGKETDASKSQTKAWLDDARGAIGGPLTIIGRAEGAPPKVMRGEYETGESVVMYSQWLLGNPGKQCDHHFLGKMAPGEWLTCLYCHRSRRLPDAKE